MVGVWASDEDNDTEWNTTISVMERRQKQPFKLLKRKQPNQTFSPQTKNTQNNYFLQLGQDPSAVKSVCYSRLRVISYSNVKKYRLPVPCPQQVNLASVKFDAVLECLL